MPPGPDIQVKIKRFELGLCIRWKHGCSRVPKLMLLQCWSEWHLYIFSTSVLSYNLLACQNGQVKQLDREIPFVLLNLTASRINRTVTVLKGIMYSYFTDGLVLHSIITGSAFSAENRLVLLAF